MLHLPKALNQNPHRDWMILLLLWLLAAIVDRLWFAFDHSVPGWDQADHLTRSLNYWRVIQNAQPHSGQWWTELWQQSSTYRAPFFYLATVPFFFLFGRGGDQATLINLVFTALLLVSTYLLGKRCFNRSIGLWAAGLGLLSPQLVYARTDYLLDYGLTALVTAVFLCLTYWRDNPVRLAWVWSLWGGLGLGLTLLTKPTGFIYFLVPGIWVLGSSLLQRQWLRLVQFVLAGVLAWLVIAPWFITNWLTIFTSMSHSNSVGAIEGDPTAATLAGWLHYVQFLPGMIS
ncbi:MAG: glycosyltransferase family 39 protein, partial [Leptolyngbyaceae cyanobacterium bins.59]|nr:glycosyltransferase family 39 protein [Leptolyngbyaceae cyanobacterium bins.59]